MSYFRTRPFSVYFSHRIGEYQPHPISQSSILCLGIVVVLFLFTTQGGEPNTDIPRLNPFAAVRPDGRTRWGYMDNEGAIVVPPVYDWAVDFDLDSSLALIYHKGKYGGISWSGEVVFKPLYAAIGPFTGNLISASEDGIHYGYLNEFAEWAIPPRYEEAFAFSGEPPLACVKRNGKYGYIDENGKTAIPFIFQDAKPIIHERMIVSLNDTYGLLNRHGQWIVKPSYENIEVSGMDSIAIFLAKKEGKWGAVDPHGEVIIPFQFSYIGVFAENGLAAASLDGKISITSTREGKFGYIDQWGTWVLPPEYAVAYRFAPNGKAPVKIGDEYALISTNGIVDEDRYTKVPNVDAMGNLHFHYSDSCYYQIDTNGERFKYIRHFANGLVLKRKNGRGRYYNSIGELVLEIDETEIYTYLRKPDGEQIYP